MRILIVALTDQLPAFLSVMNPELDVCAIVADNPEPAKAIAAQFNRAAVPIFPYWHLKECLEQFYFDYVINESMLFNGMSAINNDLLQYEVIPDKIVALINLNQPKSIDSLTKLLMIYKQNPDKFKMFSTGISYILDAIDIRQFTLPVLHCARAGQDLYYDYKIAKEVINTGGGRKNLRYALIGLAPYSFSYDASRTISESWRLLQWFLYFRDLHNFHMSVDDYSSLFRKEYLDGGYITPNPIDLNNVYFNKPTGRSSIEARLATRRSAETWGKKYYPHTIEENKHILHDYLKLCEDNDIKPILFLPAMPRGYMETYPKNRLDEFHVLLHDVMKQHSTAVFFNGWQIQGLTGDDFSDTTHLNIMGAAKFSYLLNQFVMQFERK